MPKGTTSPRRLSRASRQPPAPPHSNSVSSNSSNRAERSTRSHNKASSPQKSSTPQSLTSEDVSEEARGATSEPPQLRRSKRTLDNDEDGDTKIEGVVEDEIIEDEETTRCICGHQEYPGRPNDPTARRIAKDGHGASQEEQQDDTGGLFIQCDDCQVWQHGGCVSIMEESAVPDNYYCEECKPELHELLKSTNGQKFSHYLPVWSKSHPKMSRKGSVDKDDKSKVLKDKERQSRSSALPETKRRATMNSRAAYDEDEVLRKVLEESKFEGQAGTENGSRKGKRHRDNSEDIRSGIKRQRTTSSVLSSHSGEDDSGAESDQAAGMKKPLRNAVPKLAKEKYQKDVVIKRTGRSVRRHGNGGSDVVEPSSALADNLLEDSSMPPSARPSAKASPTAEADTPDTPTLNHANTSSTSKRGGKRPGAGRGRSNPAPTPTGERDDKDSQRNGNDGDTPVPSVAINGASIPSKRGKRGHHLKDPDSGESDKDATTTTNNNNGNTSGISGSDADIPDNNHAPHNGLAAVMGKKKEPSMNELKRRTAAMLEWVEKAKEDLGRSSVVSLMSSPGPGGSFSPPHRGKPELGSVADMLHNRLLGWQVEYGAG